ncbi:MAG: hypothetical protein ACI4A2_07925 [Candidatus Cryptobacteroides sp.]
MRTELISFLTALAAVISLSSCQKEEGYEFKGSYSYKLSGSITMQGEPLEEGSTSLAPDTITLSLESETGAMNVVSAGEGGFLVSLNPFLGNLNVFDAEVSEGKLIFLPSPVRLKAKTDEIANYALYDFTLSGEGERLENLLYATFEAQGSLSYRGRNYSVSESRIELVGTIND